MRRQFPKLEELYVGSDDEYSNTAADTFLALRG